MKLVINDYLFYGVIILVMLAVTWHLISEARRGN